MSNNEQSMCFEIIKNQERRNKRLDVICAISLMINAMLISTIAYVLTNYDISSTTTTTTTTTHTNENATFGGDFNNYNDNSSDNRVINNGGN